MPLLVVCCLFLVAAALDLTVAKGSSNNVNVVTLPDDSFEETLEELFQGANVVFRIDESLVNVTLQHADIVLRSCLPVRRIAGSIAVMNNATTRLRNIIEFLNEELNLNRGGSSDFATWFRLVQESGYRGSKCARVDLPLTKENLLPYLLRSQPVVFAGGSLLAKEKVANLSRFAETPVWVKVAPAGQFEGVEAASKWDSDALKSLPERIRDSLPYPDLICVRPFTWQTTLSAFLDKLELSRSNHSANYYLQYFPNPFETTLRDPFESMLDKSTENIWLGDGKTVGKLHFDEFDNIMSVVSGEKTFKVFNPWKNENLYESHIRQGTLGFHDSTEQFVRQELSEATCMVMSPVDIIKPDLNRFPLFKNAKSFDCKVREGDALFLPSFWWHEVSSSPGKDGRNLAVNLWYHPMRKKEFPCAECPLWLNEERYGKRLVQLHRELSLFEE